ncbi:MAG: hypothetical protein J6C37_11520 [Roseburia sp.]|nr:hypothetical protein [Roseburia sp.]
MLAEYFKKMCIGRILVMILGNVIIGLGVSIFRLSGLGNDPFNGMVMAMGAFLDMPYANFQVMLNVVLLLIEIFAGRKYIGVGTFVNALLLGYFSTFFNFLLAHTVNEPQAMWQRVIVVFLGVIVCSLGLSLYQGADVGVAPYDSLPMILTDRWPKVPYFCYRISLDALFALICYLAGGIVGLGTLVSAFGLGYFINLFNKYLTAGLLKRIDGRKK